MRQRSNSEWLAALGEAGRIQEAALAELRWQLLGAIKSYLVKEGSLLHDDAGHLAEDCTQEALLIVQAKLNSFRGESRFTTWVFSIAIRLVLGELRRRRWQQASVETAQLGQVVPDWPIEAPGPERSLQQREAWAFLTGLIDTALTPLQRTVLIAHAFQEMPLDLVAEWLGSNRNSLYKLVHDARKRLRQALLARGVTHKELIAMFEVDAQGVSPHFSCDGKIPSVQPNS